MRPVRSLPVRLTVALGLAAGAALSAPAGAESSCFQVVVDGPEFCSEQVWFMPGDSKAGNLAAVGAAGHPTWSTDAPTQSVTQGAGGGYATLGAQRQLNDPYDPATGGLFKGTFTGDLDNLAVTMYLFSPGRNSDDGWYGGVDVVVDGVNVYSTNANGIPLTPGGNAVQKIDFAVSGLHKSIERAGLETGPEAAHEVELFVTSYTLATTTAMLVYGTTEAPSSMTFNVEDVKSRFLI